MIVVLARIAALYVAVSIGVLVCGVRYQYVFGGVGIAREACANIVVLASIAVCVTFGLGGLVLLPVAFWLEET